MAEKRKRTAILEKETENPEIWQDKEKAIRITQELDQFKEEIKNFDKLKEELEIVKELVKEDKSSFPTSLSPYESSLIEDFEKKLKKAETETFLSGKYDKGNAILTIYAGAGGQDAQDWATILLRMYERFAVSYGFRSKIFHQSFGEGGGPEGRIGTKQASLEIKGKYAFGLFKKESGVHRLVRISPFSSKSLRHTSFALVEVLPEITKNEESEVKINPEELKIDYYRASGPGGQYVNKRETAVRITHLPTGIAVSCQSERLQGSNRERAMKVLISKLYQLKEEKKEKELKEIKGKAVSASWGNQIRSYVLHPYKMVKDLRTGIETSKVEAVLDGDLTQFIEAETKL